MNKKQINLMKLAASFLTAVLIITSVFALFAEDNAVIVNAEDRDVIAKIEQLRTDDVYELVRINDNVKILFYSNLAKGREAQNNNALYMKKCEDNHWGDAIRVDNGLADNTRDIGFTYSVVGKKIYVAYMNTTKEYSKEISENKKYKSTECVITSINWENMETKNTTVITKESFGSVIGENDTFYVSSLDLSKEDDKLFGRIIITKADADNYKNNAKSLSCGISFSDESNQFVINSVDTDYEPVKLEAVKNISAYQVLSEKKDDKTVYRIAYMRIDNQNTEDTKDDLGYICVRDYIPETGIVGPEKVVRGDIPQLSGFKSTDFNMTEFVSVEGEKNNIIYNLLDKSVIVDDKKLSEVNMGLDTIPASPGEEITVPYTVTNNSKNTIEDINIAVKIDKEDPVVTDVKKKIDGGKTFDGEFKIAITQEMISNGKISIEYSFFYNDGNDKQLLNSDKHTLSLTARKYLLTVINTKTDKVISEKEYAYDKTPASPANPAKYAGYTFAGWITADGQDFVFEEPLVEDTTVYTNWKENTVEFFYQAQDDAACEVSSMSEDVFVISGKADGAKATPAKGYKFLGWYLNNTLITNKPTITPKKNSSGMYEGGIYEARVIADESESTTQVNETTKSSETLKSAEATKKTENTNSEKLQGNNEILPDDKKLNPTTKYYMPQYIGDAANGREDYVNSTDSDGADNKADGAVATGDNGRVVLFSMIAVMAGGLFVFMKKH